MVAPNAYNSKYNYFVSHYFIVTLNFSYNSNIITATYETELNPVGPICQYFNFLPPSQTLLETRIHTDMFIKLLLLEISSALCPASLSSCLSLPQQFHRCHVEMSWQSARFHCWKFFRILNFQIQAVQNLFSGIAKVTKYDFFAWFGQWQCTDLSFPTLYVLEIVRQFIRTSRLLLFVPLLVY